MNELVKETEVLFNGQKGEVKVLPLTLNHLDPFNIAYDLVGGDFYWWILETPERCHEFLRKITTGLILAEWNIRKIDPRKREFYMLAEDPSQVLSVEQFLEFTVPYTNMMFNEFGKGCIDGRGIHMCGKSPHLHEALINNQQMTSFNLFGYQVEPEVVAKNLGSKCLLWGNINPMLMLTGTREEVKTEAMKALEAMAPCGGLLLGDGANVCPGTPIENLAVLTEASEEYAQYHPELFNTWASVNLKNDSDERNITNLC
jgi:uroporphyrinogen-III decarboxylase